MFRKAPDNDNGRVTVRQSTALPVRPLSRSLVRSLVQHGLGDLTLNDVSRLGPKRLASIAMAPIWSGRN